MKRYLLDSGIAGDFVNDRGIVRARVQAAVRGGHRIGLGTPILGELLGGVLGSNAPERHRARLQHQISPLMLWTFDKPAAHEYGRLYAELQRAGRKIQSIDIQLAAIALTLGGGVVVTKDSDFGSIVGLEIENWSI